MLRYKCWLSMTREPSVSAANGVLEDEDYAVDYVLAGEEGLERAVGGSYDVILLDLEMPGMHGLEVLEMIKKRRPELVVIIITGYATIQTSIEAIKKGAFD